MPEHISHVGIVGAGLGGLAAAIGIARAGHRVTILEQAAALGEVSRTLSLRTYRLIPGPDWCWDPNCEQRFFKNYGALSARNRN